MKRLRLHCGACGHQLGDVVRPQVNGTLLRPASPVEPLEVYAAAGIGKRTFLHEFGHLEQDGPYDVEDERVGVTWTLTCVCRARSGKRRAYRLTGQRLRALREQNRDAPEKVVRVDL